MFRFRTLCFFCLLSVISGAPKLKINVQEKPAIVTVKTPSLEKLMNQLTWMSRGKESPGMFPIAMMPYLFRFFDRPAFSPLMNPYLPFYMPGLYRNPPFSGTGTPSDVTYKYKSGRKSWPKNKKKPSNKFWAKLKTRYGKDENMYQRVKAKHSSSSYVNFKTKVPINLFDKVPFNLIKSIFMQPPIDSVNATTTSDAPTTTTSAAKGQIGETQQSMSNNKDSPPTLPYKASDLLYINNDPIVKTSTRQGGEGYEIVA